MIKKRVKARSKAKAYRGDSRAGKLTPAVRVKFLEFYGSGLSAQAAAKKAGVTHIAIFKLKRRDPDFLAQFLVAQQASVDIMEDRMLARAVDNRANNGHLTAMFGILRARRPDVWRETAKVTHEHKGAVELVGAFAQAMQEMPSGIPAKPH